MKPLLFTLLFCLVFTPCHAWQCKVVNVSDGDTITCLKNGNTQVKIRLSGIDAPEKKQAFGQRARQALASLIAGQTIEVEDCGLDRYGRTIGILKSAGQNINRQMLLDGFAWVYPAYCKRPECREWKQAETQAKEARRGLWQDKNPIPPWEWRRQKKAASKLKRQF